MRKSPFPFRSGELKFYLHGMRILYTSKVGGGMAKNGYRLMATIFCMSRKKSPGTPQNVGKPVGSILVLVLYWLVNLVDTQYRWSCI